MSYLIIKQRVVTFISFFIVFFLLFIVEAEAKNVLKLEPLSKESYSENFTLVARLDNEAYLLVQAMIMNGGFGDEKPACRVLYAPSNGKAINDVNRGDHWNYVEHQDKLQIGSCLLQRTANGLIWKAETELLSVELNLTGQRGRFKTKNMQIKSKDGFSESHVIMPQADVLALIKQKSKPRQKLKGIGLVNHARSTALPPKLAKRWFKLYAFGKGSSSEDPSFLILDVRYPPNKAKPIAWSWQSDQNSPKNYSPNGILFQKMLGKGKLEAGQKFTLTGNSNNYEVYSIKPMFRYEPIKAYGLMGRMLKSWVGDPVNQSSFVEIQAPTGKMMGMVEEVLFR